MTQSKFWRFDINSQQNQQSQSPSPSSTTQSGQTGQNQKAFLIIEATDQQSALQNAQRVLGVTQSSTLGTPTQVDESQAKQYQTQQV